MQTYTWMYRNLSVLPGAMEESTVYNKLPPDAMNLLTRYTLLQPIVEAVDCLWGPFLFLLTWTRFLCACLAHPNPILQAMNRRERKRLLPHQHHIHKPGVAFTESTWEKSDFPSTSRKENYYKKQGRFSGDLVGLPSGRVQWMKSTVPMPAVFWSASRRKWNREGQTRTCNLEKDHCGTTHGKHGLGKVPTARKRCTSVM